MNTLLLALLISQPPPVPGGQAPDVPDRRAPDVPEQRPFAALAPAPAPLTFTEAQQQAIREGKPLVVFAGGPARPIAGAVTVSVKDLDGTTRNVIVSLDGVNGWWLPLNASDAAIAKRMGVQAAAIPFEQPSSSPSVPSPPSSSDSPYAPPVADASPTPAGPWADEIEFPAGMVSYQPSQWTQEIAVTNGRDRISKVSRFGLAQKWHFPGGMLGVKGFRSDLYKKLPNEPRVFVGNIPVWNGSNYQNNRGYRREYADGSEFHDVLSYEGQVFEHRKREKVNGKWESSVIFKDASARPDGYTGLKGQTCASCHNEAGTGGYAAGLVPGGDGVLSDPFDALESGGGGTMTGQGIATYTTGVSGGVRRMVGFRRR